MIAKGEVDIKKVRTQIKQVLQTDEGIDEAAKHYEEAYSGTGLTADEIWEEIICDSLGDMNIFSKTTNAESAELMSTAIPAIQQAVSETKGEATNPDAQVEGKASRSSDFEATLDGKKENGYNSRELYTSSNKFIREVHKDDRSDFMLSLSKQTSGMQDGDIKTIVINGWQNTYLFKADGYMTGEMWDKGKNSNKKDLKRFWRNAEDELHKDGEATDIWSDPISVDGGREVRNISLSENGRAETEDDRLASREPSSHGARGAEQAGRYSGTLEEFDRRLKSAARDALGLNKSGRRSTSHEATLDSDYLDAVNRGDMELAQKMVDEAATKAGDTERVFHGTRSDEFYVFDSNRIGDNYGGYNAEGGAFDFTYDEGRAWLWAGKAKGTGKPRVIKAFIKAEKPFYSYDGQVAKELFDLLPEELSDEEKRYAMSYGIPFKEVLEQHGIDFKTAITSKGIDSYMMYKGDFGNIGVYSPFQIKSADPVTYDDDGNVIPLSERFNPKNSDIRYSRELDLDYDENIEATKTLTNRDILVGALESATTSQVERYRFTTKTNPTTKSLSRHRL